MKPIQILLVVAAVAMAGCRAQGTAPAAVSQSGVPPQAMADILVVELNSLNNSIAALANDIDVSGTGLTITGVMVDQTLPPMSGAVASTDGNTVTFSPPSNFTGVVTLQYAIVDGTGAVSSAMIAVSVLPVALPPVALPDVTTVLQDSGATDIDVLANDVDFAGGGLTLTGVAVAASLPAATHAVAIVGNQVQFTPAAAFVGAVVVDYTVTDVNGSSAVGVLTIVVSPLDLALGPVPVPDAALVMQDAAATDIDVLANDVDPAGGGLNLTGLAVTTSLPAATHTVAIVGNQVQFTPAAGFAGSVVVTYTATDVNGDSADGVLAVVVSPLALQVGPVAIPDVAVVAQDSVANDIDVVANDVDLAGGGLTLTGLTVTASLPAATHAVAIVGNQVQITPAAGFAGIVVITYAVTDVNGDSADGVLTIVVSPLALQVGPVAIPDAVVVAQDSAATDIDVVANDVDLAGGGLTLTGVAVTASLPAATHAVAVVGNQVQFTPAAAFVGVVLVDYTVTDVNGNSAVGVLTVVVSPLDLTVGPVPVPDAVIVTQDSAATMIDVLANDVDPAGGGLTLTGVAVTASLPAATHTVAISGNQVQFTPAAGFAGSVVVTYTVTDVNGDSADGVLTIVVSPLALQVGPVTIPDAAVVAQDSVANDIDVLANDVDPAGGGLTLTGVTVTTSLPAAAHAVAIVGNQVQFTPAAGFAGSVVVTYTVTDVNGDSADGVLTIVVSPLDLTVGPVPVPDAATVMQDSAATAIDVLANDVDPAGGGLTLTGVTVTASVPAAAHAVAIVGNQVQFTPAAGFAGSVVVTYTVTDVNGDSADGVLTIVVSPLALPVGPVAIPDAAVVAQDSVANDIDVVANDVDFAGGGLTLTGVTVTSSLPTALHTVAISGNQVQFTPAAGFAGVVVVTYTIVDVNGDSYNGLLDIEVSPTPLVLGPVAAPDTATVSSLGGPVLIDVLANDVDPAGGGLTLTAVSIDVEVPAGSGSVAMVGNQVQYTPTLGYIGAVLVRYTATDINGNTTVGELSLTVVL